MTSRRRAREIAFQFLYSKLAPAVGITAVGGSLGLKAEFENFCNSFELLPDEFAWELVEGTRKNLPSLDEAISKLSTNWRLDRMPLVDKTILRISCFEILFRKDVPKTVTINEAVEIAKKFGETDSASFVNGILDKLDKPSEVS